MRSQLSCLRCVHIYGWLCHGIPHKLAPFPTGSDSPVCSADPNVVTLHRTLETPSFLLLLLEFVPGEDLFYFLEQARDHYETDPATIDMSTSPPVSDSSCASRTPPTPSLLSSLNPAQLLSRTRLRLIASMFSQMCEAVATCHENSVFHRDIKPENFIVTDGWTTLPDGRSERKVVVKLGGLARMPSAGFASNLGRHATGRGSSGEDSHPALTLQANCRQNPPRRQESPTRRQNQNQNHILQPLDGALTWYWRSACDMR